MPLHKVRFTGENLYMLLFAAKYSTWLVPFTAATPKELSTYNPASLLVSHDSNGIHAFLLHRANQVLKLLPPCKTTLFWNFERTFKAHLVMNTSPCTMFLWGMRSPVDFDIRVHFGHKPSLILFSTSHALPPFLPDLSISPLKFVYLLLLL